VSLINSPLLSFELEKDIRAGVAAHNEEQNIGQLLDVLTSIQLFRHITVVSSGSTDTTNAIVQERSRNDPRIKLIEETTRSGKSNAVNRLIRESPCDILVFMSGDTIPTKESVDCLLKWFDDPNVGAVSAKPVPVNPKKGFGYVAHIMWSAHWNYMWNLTLSKKLVHVSGEMCAFSTQALSHIPHDIINEDSYLAIASKTKGLKILIDPNAIVYMRAPTNIVELINQRRRVIAGHKQILKRTSHFPTVLVTSWWKNLPEFARTAAAVFREFRLRLFLWGVVLLQSETVAFALTVGHLGRTMRSPWEPLTSTKRVS